MDAQERIEKARERVVEALSKNMDLYGVTPSIGRLYGILYFNDGPMTLEEMSEALGMSKTSMSTGVKTLTDLKMVEKTWKKGVRKDLYRVEEDWYETFSHFFCIKWRKSSVMNQAAIERSLSELQAVIADERTPDELREKAQRDVARLEEAQQYYQWLNRLVDAFETGEIFKYIPR
ncbi:choline uptake/conversion transcriptional regulator CudC [Heliorestis convoluta]|uniref:HTH-type transcriptional regulator n=1 Tax=Heliorestis convoluta TaxID=356322 RepID=A0A5Q2N2Y4_9FIRM|nr:GbsR/MarR family transcriptional regulator [Heliorestis convoluta]QGG49358.1 GbsR/MarR family transcriptional regulator [Heliorestis convoluta]